MFYFPCQAETSSVMHSFLGKNKGKREGERERRFNNDLSVLLNHIFNTCLVAISYKFLRDTLASKLS